jgi:serine/threonine-protein kinase
VWETVGPKGEKLALKFMHAIGHRSAPEELRSIQRIRALEHTHLIHFEQVWSHPQFIIIAMELADGSLQDLLDVHQEEFGTCLAAEDVVEYLTQVADVLDFLNTRQHNLNGQRVGYQHCDVKPSNLLLCGTIVKLCDFGLSAPTTATLRPHRRAGTTAYTAPEVFQGCLSSTTDQYALAITYCQLRVGRLPFADSPKTFTKSYLRPDPDLSKLDPEEARIIARALSNIPQQRWPSCRELMARLGQVIATRKVTSNVANTKGYRKGGVQTPKGGALTGAADFDASCGHVRAPA